MYLWGGSHWCQGLLRKGTVLDNFAPTIWALIPAHSVSKVPSA